MTIMAPAHRALVTAPFRGEGLDTLNELADVVLDPWIDHTPLRIYDGEKLADRIKQEGADIVVVESDFVSGPVFDLPLVAIGSCRGDPNNVDVVGATKAGIPVLRPPGRNADAVAELAGARLFTATRGLLAAEQSLRSALVSRPDTHGMIGAARCGAMKDGVVLLNTARAQLHDMDALVACLRSGKVSAAGLDHFVGERLDPDHPLTSMTNVVLTPHIGGATFDTE